MFTLLYCWISNLQEFIKMEQWKTKDMHTIQTNDDKFIEICRKYSDEDDAFCCISKGFYDIDGTKRYLRNILVHKDDLNSVIEAIINVRDKL